MVPTLLNNSNMLWFKFLKTLNETTTDNINVELKVCTNAGLANKGIIYTSGYN